MDNSFQTGGWGRGDGLGMTHVHDLYRALYPYRSTGSTSAQVLDPRGGGPPRLDSSVTECSKEGGARAERCPFFPSFGSCKSKQPTSRIQCFRLNPIPIANQGELSGAPSFEP